MIAVKIPMGEVDMLPTRFAHHIITSNDEIAV
ncbi:hypothetical protein BPO_2046 [Bergeyella porcorum]|uniref:Uncharacterized protein n=1 Tax=Bergeyella porcorum TaxID=1735111 RepID=A0AAU0F9J2_9FLAO